MSVWLRRIGIIIYTLATIALYGIGHQDLFWLCLALGLAYLMLCGHVQKHLLMAAKERHEQIRDHAAPLGISQQDLENFSQLPPRVIAQDYKAVPAKLAYLTHTLFVAGLLLLVFAFLFRLLP
jgi:hypothetical protein